MERVSADPCARRVAPGGFRGFGLGCASVARRFYFFHEIHTKPMDFNAFSNFLGIAVTCAASAALLPLSPAAKGCAEQLVNQGIPLILKDFIVPKHSFVERSPGFQFFAQILIGFAIIFKVI